MGILAYLQRIGRSLMVPVAVLPAAAILLGIGYWIDPNGWGQNSIIAAFLIKSGGAIIENMPILFAIGVAYGMSKDKDGAAALSGLVGFLVVTTLLSPSSIALFNGIDTSVDGWQSQISPAFKKINNQFVGILVGIIAAELYNRFSSVELHKALAFFSGKRLVPIIVSIVMLLVSAVLYFIWPSIYDALVAFGKYIKDLGSIGAGIYGFFNRLLIPVGLHHALNSVFWFDVAGINDIPTFLGGQKSIDDGLATIGITGRYQAGFFPIMMFGLPGAALAMYHTAKKGNKDKTASIMLAASFAAFFTGVTEPLEFAFMFVAPLLYVIHAILTGISLFIAATMQWIAGFGFSAGLIDMLLSSRNPLAVHWYMLILQGLVFFVVYYVVFRFVIVKFNLKTPGREDDETVTTNSQNSQSGLAISDASQLAQQYLLVVGGKENLTNIDSCITRLRLSVNDSDLIDEQAAKALGAMAVIKLGKTGVQIVVGQQAEKIADQMKKLV
ncbi:PTS transporter subunit EIIBC [Gilliamella sp. B3791]|uniref:N-acetylglucosamine-specific PTS transporter subunit IIBC n=1 Tax=unclassified Gilliamella TaxID=2685620 RepID=UPI0022698D65|nr:MULTISPECIES: N-acetylglucosamine-specific PTS transporter subunit IIBC [unclassified Gilliamella]MCX8642701.1 PTS transporter subunit EIIBC [Gilliamella sp. B3835]MCX8708069.1 PTS transporter subunit EIIBC [Gilliamella sp. B3783]MCX8709041.1 PTS transporter subunit EIIBC [Gilliamella sp. B3780]MCX8712589.1 PTS transporter subunit EIIBC [Gilliamella sp. B3468]MCX8717264.1 PTS transporter subunit EIIBC [Gilliamella sp. B3784]